MLWALARSGHQAYLIAAATHPDTPDEALTAPLVNEDDIYRRVDYPKNTVGDGFWQAHIAVARRRGLHPDVAAYLAGHDEMEVAEVGLTNRAVPAWALNVHSRSDDAWRRRLTAAHPKYPAEALEALASDSDDRVRRVAGNPKASDDVRSLAALTL